ncbi:MAG: hypothetical protein GF331_12860 [Chitinivibrionales bacterium]|nr:hypothetical protein [Chitinivibrionales bacterium]
MGSIDIETNVAHAPERALARLLRRAYHRNNAPFALLRALSQAERLDEVHNYLHSPHHISVAYCLLGREDSLLRRYPDNRDARARAYESQGKVDSLLVQLPDRLELCVRALTYSARYDELRARYPYHRTDAADLLLAQGRYQTVIDSFPDQRTQSAFALVRLGRGDAVLERFTDLRDPCARALLADDRLDTARQHYPEFRTLYAEYLLSTGRYTDVVRDYRDRTREYGLALLELGAHDQLPFDSATFRLSRRERHSILTLLALLAHTEGRHQDSDSLMAARPGLYRGDLDDAHLRFGDVLLQPLLHAFEGDGTALRHTWKQAGHEYRYAWTQRLWHELAYLIGEIDDRKFLSQPYRIGVDGRLTLLQAIRADLAGRDTQAIDAYRSALSSPLTPTEHARRSLLRSAVVRRFVLWRLSALGGVQATADLPRYAFGAYVVSDLK